MNRDIKFRGKRLDNGEWVYGGYYADERSTCIIVEERVQTKPNDVNGPAEYDTEPRFYDVDPITVGQYTGLKDKNGVDIYEGDVVKWQQAAGGILPPNARAYICVIEWGWDHSWRCKYTLKDTCFTFASSHIEVIGNIYENPELLEANNA